MWLELLQKIQDVIEHSGFDGQVKLGFLNPKNAGIDEFGMVFLGRGECSPIDDQVHNMLSQEFYLETWTRCDEADFEKAYESIAKLESLIERVMTNFRTDCGELNPDACILPNSGFQIVDIRCTSKVDDRDTMRPFIGTQYRFEARMYDLNQDTKGGIY